MYNELLAMARHCRFMSDHTTDLTAAGEFRKLAERLEGLSKTQERTIARAAELSDEVDSEHQGRGGGKSPSIIPRVE